MWFTVFCPREKMGRETKKGKRGAVDFPLALPPLSFFGSRSIFRADKTPKIPFLCLFSLQTLRNACRLLTSRLPPLCYLPVIDFVIFCDFFQISSENHAAGRKTTTTFHARGKSKFKCLSFHHETKHSLKKSGISYRSFYWNLKSLKAVGTTDIFQEILHHCINCSCSWPFGINW